MASDSGDRPLKKKRSMGERVDAWGESQKAARKNIPKKRARTQRAYRHAVKAELQANGEQAEPQAIRRKPFRKWSGPTRATQLERQAGRQAKLRQTLRRSEEARLRRSLRRGKGDPSRQLSE